MADQPLVSVLIPVFNGERTIGRAIRSLLSQTYEHWEAIVVDDGSNDQTLKVLSEFQDDRLKIFAHERNLGRAAARQTSLNQAKGEFIAFLDADDFYDPHKLDIQLKAIMPDQSLSLISCRMGSFDENLNLVSVRTKFPFRPEIFKAGSDFRFSRAGSLIRKDAIGDTNYDLSLNYAEDTDFLIRVVSGKRIATVPELLYYYSELESISKKKILIGSLYSLKVNMKHIRFSFWRGLQNSATCFFKLLVKLTLLPFLNVTTIARQRGKEPTRNDRSTFRSALDRSSQ